MNTLNRYAKLLFAVFAAFMLIFVACGSMSAEKVTSATPSQVVVSPQSNLYKYLNHVPVTQYEWTAVEGNELANRASSGPGPTTDHLLWEGIYCKTYEGLNQYGAIFNGKVFIRTDTSKSIYPGVTYALDENTGKVLWSAPYSSGNFIKLDNERMISGTRCFAINNGSLLWIAERSIDLYIPEYKIGITNGPAVGYAKTVMAYDLSNPSLPPKQLWTGEPEEDIASFTYGDGKLVLCGLDYHMWCLDAQTGRKLWSRQIASLSSRYHVGVIMYGNAYIQSHNGFWCYSMADGSTLWHSGLLDTGRFAVGFGRVVAMQTRTYTWCWDAYDGHVIWKYLPVRDIPHPCGPGAPGQCNHTSHHISFYAPSIGANGYAYVTSMQKTTYGALVPANYQGVEYPVGSGTYYWVNPLNRNATAHAGENEFVCINIYTGEVVWRVGHGWPYGPNTGTAAKPAYAGPDMGQSIIGDGRVYGIEQPYSSHTGVGTSRPELDPGITNPKGAWFKPLLANLFWYPGRVYCFGAGPTVLTASVATPQVKATEIATFSGSLTDLSPAYPGTPAPTVPITIRWTLPDGSKGIIDTVTTDKDGKWTYSWIPYTPGEYTIIFESAGSPAYESPDPVVASINVQPAVDIIPLLETGLVVLIIAAVALPIIVYRMRKPKV
jgi:outer membrane protein assembly factor BamB